MQFHAELLAGHALGLAFVSRVRGEALQRGVPLGRLPQHRTRFRPVGLVGRAHVHGQQSALAVDSHVARAPFDLLAPVQATLLAFRCCLDRLAVQDRLAWRTLRAARATSRQRVPSTATASGQTLRFCQRRQWS